MTEAVRVCGIHGSVLEGPACDDCIADRNGLLSDLEDKNRELRRLASKLERDDTPDAPAARIREVLKDWQEKTGHTKAKIPMTGERAAKVRARLNERFTVDELKKANTGAQRFPYVVNGKRVASGSPENRYDDAVTIFKNERTTELLIQLADEDPPVAATPTPTGPTPPRPFSSPFDRAVAILRVEFGTDALWTQWDDDNLKADAVWSVCPLHPGRLDGWPMRLRERGREGSALDVACVEGCDSVAIREAIVELERKHDAWLLASATAAGAAYGEFRAREDLHREAERAARLRRAA